MHPAHEHTTDTKAHIRDINRGKPTHYAPEAEPHAFLSHDAFCWRRTAAGDAARA